MPPNSSTVPVVPTSRRFSQFYIPLPVYLGLDVHVNADTGKVGYSVSVHDGSYTTDYYSGEFTVDTPDVEPGTPDFRRMRLHYGLEKLLEVVRLFSLAQHYKVQIVAISRTIAEALLKCDGIEGPSAASRFWSELDAIPFHVHVNGETPDELASAAVRKAVMWMSPQYPVDFDGLIHICDIDDYRNTVCDETWRVVNEMAKEFRERKLRVAFFNSTPQGGGVALMRHALLRFFRHLKIDAHWYVARPKPEVFDITKRKFHNVLQGVAPPDVRLKEHDKQIFIDWSNENAERFWLDANGPIKTSDVIVIDDPQLVGIIPHIKKHAPEARIIFRSHIEMRADLIRENPDGPQAETWNFLWQFIQHADIFIAHPMTNFVPDVVPRKNVVLLPATTDLLDGLNKPLDPWVTGYYQSVFNRVCIDQGSNEIEWSRRYIVQVARFDPSKGIPDVLESYRILRKKLTEHGMDDFEVPQLVVCGHGSIDDPDGTVIYEQTHRMLQRPEFADIAADIIVARLPPSDQLLNLVMSNALVALQLSHREGFEVKVTEALHKGIPVVAYQAGGIPLQIVNNADGFLVPIGDVEGVADRLFRLITDNDLHATMSKKAKELVTEEFFTVWNSMSWLHMFLELTNEASRQYESNGLLDEEATFKRNSGLGNDTKVCKFWQKKYNYKPMK
ncbi:hypothetical protein BX666DRAFT_1856628 [Dichotomocladium elegans]|nr:hypothetical protein BX666DRAFT_1856628 [Dichotomocladium elegans]